MSIEKVKYSNSDIILDPGIKINPKIIDLDEWDPFLEVLCRDRTYQKNAIKTALSYLFSGQYKSIEDLIDISWKSNDELQKRYSSLKDYHNSLQLPKKLYAIGKWKDHNHMFTFLQALQNNYPTH